MPGALLELVAKGSQDIFLTGNPNIIYLEVYIKDILIFPQNQFSNLLMVLLILVPNLKQKFLEVGDLLSSIIIEVDLPKLEGKRGKDIYWVDAIGHHLIKEVRIEIGEQEIDKHYGEWLEIWSELTMPESKRVWL